jgi:hypothetical protein
MPAILPSGVCTRHSPIQKSNWRYSGLEHGAAADACATGAISANSSHMNRTMAAPRLFQRDAIERRRGP